jgi:hypothetical protein
MYKATVSEPQMLDHNWRLPLDNLIVKVLAFSLASGIPSVPFHPTSHVFSRNHFYHFRRSLKRHLIMSLVAGQRFDHVKH